MAKKKAAKKEVDTSKLEHVLIPLHEKLSDKDKEKVLKDFGISVRELPKILKTDPAVRHLAVQPGDVVRITRVSEKAGTQLYFRGVIDA